MAICLMHGAATLHNQAVYAVMKSPMAFFDATPVGRIINRFSKDLDDSKIVL
jgi:ATP-binding cassette subfamily C (CFTR/MRP) protein 1